ncbi:AbiU2 domain-containing protein [Lentisalinibacter sediminis]|uniref:AbiU2 domain-containing protein n=1 Tax=Lentisalinibacter sediminis TaxID=2992237 RepID=UPI00386BF93C
MKPLRLLSQGVRDFLWVPAAPPEEETDAHVKRLQGMTSLIADRFFELQARQKILNPMLYDPELSRAIGKSYAANAWNFLIQSLFFDQIRGICAVVWDRDPRTYSVRNAIRLLERGDVLGTIRAEQSQPVRMSEITPIPPDIRERLYRKEAARLGESFSKQYEELFQNWREFQSQGYRKPFQTIRNRVIAHHEIVEGEDRFDTVDVSEFGLKWGDTDACLKKLAPVVFGLELVARGHSYAYEQFSEIHEKWAADLWRRLLPAHENLAVTSEE